jgi:hypothetical protein
VLSTTLVHALSVPEACDLLVKGRWGWHLSSHLPIARQWWVWLVLLLPLLCKH